MGSHKPWSARQQETCGIHAAGDHRGISVSGTEGVQIGAVRGLYFANGTSTYQDNTIKNNNIVITGIKPNGYITIHILDEYLRTINTIDTTINTTSITKINTYNYNNKLHILLTTDDYLLIDNIIYEIDETYNITNKNFVTYNEEELLSILKSDYYLIKNTYTNKDNENYYYKYSTYNKEYNIIAGYKQDELLNTTNIITYININNESNTITLPNQVLDIISINNELLVLNTDNINTYISKYDMLGNLIETVQTNSINKLNLISNNLVTSDINTLTYYEYDCTINIIETPYGTLTTTKDPKPYEIVDINVLSNSGYEIETIKITDIEKTTRAKKDQLY